MRKIKTHRYDIINIPMIKDGVSMDTHLFKSYKCITINYCDRCKQEGQ